ncbi:MAG TPA: FAD-binding protein [Nocardioidaceae bacterium]|nr:FAD-binding protein [Nocardioidaceae bacterium]
MTPTPAADVIVVGTGSASRTLSTWRATSRCGRPASTGSTTRTCGRPKLDVDAIRRQIVARDREVANPFGKDVQVMAIHNARRSRTDRLIRVAKPHRILDPAHGPLIGVRLNILSRKTLGGLQTNLDSQVLDADGEPITGLYAAGEVAGFGGGGVHGYNALEGTFLGGCIFSGRAAGLALARE